MRFSSDREGPIPVNSLRQLKETGVSIWLNTMRPNIRAHSNSFAARLAGGLESLRYWNRLAPYHRSDVDRV